jgi:hypothetical protein
MEITLGAAVAGPFDVDKTALETMIARVIRHQTGAGTPARPTIH